MRRAVALTLFLLFAFAGAQSVVDALRGSAKRMSVAVSQTYDAVGRLVAVADATGRVKTLAYDASGRLIGTQYASGSRVTTAYDAAGRAIVVQNPGGSTTYAYSPRGDFLGKTDPGGLT